MQYKLKNSKKQYEARWRATKKNQIRSSKLVVQIGTEISKYKVTEREAANQ